MALCQHSHDLPGGRVHARFDSLGFALSKDLLLTVRFKPMKAFEDFKDNIARHPLQAGGPGALITVLEVIIDHAADILEGAANDLDRLSEEIFGTHNANTQPHRPREDGEDLRGVLGKIGRNGDLASKMGDVLLGMSRMSPFVSTDAASYLSDDFGRNSRACNATSAPLNDYETHLTNKIQFLLDATLGLTNIEQNNIFRIFTVVSVIGIPPTFFASLCGMNFKAMPEFDWAYGYAWGISIIAVSAIIPIICSNGGAGGRGAEWLRWMQP